MTTVTVQEVPSSSKATPTSQIATSRRPARADDSRKKKKKSHSTSARSDLESSIVEKEKVREAREREQREVSDHVEEKREPGPSASGGRKMTEAERRFEETQRKRVSGPHLLSAGLMGHQREEKAKKMATQSHKDRVSDFNQRLDRLRQVFVRAVHTSGTDDTSEHHDMPRVSLASCPMRVSRQVQWVADVFADRAWVILVRIRRGSMHLFLPARTPIPCV